MVTNAVKEDANVDGHVKLLLTILFKRNIQPHITTLISNASTCSTVQYNAMLYIHIAQQLPYKSLKPQHNKLRLKWDITRSVFTQEITISLFGANVNCRGIYLQCYWLTSNTVCTNWYVLCKKVMEMLDIYWYMFFYSFVARQLPILYFLFAVFCEH